MRAHSGSLRFALLAALWLLGLGAASVSAQIIPPTDPCTADVTDLHYREYAVGETVTLCFQYREDQFPTLKYFRVRRSQTIAGGYYEWFRLKPAHWQTWFYFQFPADRNWHIFITACWDETVNNVTTTQETTGSDHVQIKIRGAASLSPPEPPESGVVGGVP